MELARRTRWLALALPVALAAGASLARPAPPGALAAGPLPDRVCAMGTAGVGAPYGSGNAWYRLDAVLDAGGTLAGRRLTAGRGTTRWSAVLPPESFASGPVGGRIVVGDDDGRRSRLRLLDTAGGCWMQLGTTADVVRSAVQASDGSRIYEHRVERGSRRDLGVWRRDVVGRPMAAQPVLAGLRADAVYGPTFATTLLADEDGRVVVSACGERACRTRVLDPATGTVASVDGAGPAVGLAAGRLVALEACDGLPCGLEAVDLATGRASRLDEASGSAVAVAGPPGVVVLADEGGLGVVLLDSGIADLEVPGSDGLAPVGLGSTAGSGIEPPAGRIAVAPDGRVSDPSLVRFLDPAALTLTEGEVLP